VTKVGSGEVSEQREREAATQQVLSTDEPRSLASVRGVWHGQVREADGFDELPRDLAVVFGAIEDDLGSCNE
jgi:hypothetical protein